MTLAEERIEKAVKLIQECGGWIEGDHHRAWLVDQVLQALLGEEDYRAWVEWYEQPEEEEDVYTEWPVGIPP